MRGQIKWDNEDLEEIELSKTDEKLVQPDFIDEVPGIAVQGDYDKIIGSNPDAGSDKDIPSVAQRKAEASKNAGRNLEANTQVKARGVNIGSSDGSVIDLSGDDDKPDGGVYPVKQEPVIIKKHQTTHRHWSVGVTETILTTRMTTPHQQDKDTV